MIFNHRQSQDGEVLFIEPRMETGDGPYVAIQRDDTTGQWGVHINTEQLDADQGTTNPDAEPRLDVYLNDATLYTAERDQVKQ